jgi:hypothetical protein
MMVENLTHDDGVFKLSGTTLPGLFKSCSVGSSLRWDDVKKENSPSGSVKIPRGWEDADIAYTAVLTNDEESDPYKKLTIINGIFRKKKNKDPVVYRVLNKHLKARGLSKVYFSKLSSRENNKRDTIEVMISFKEHKQKMSKSKNHKKTIVPKKDTSYLDNDMLHCGIVEKTEWTEDVGE